MCVLFHDLEVLRLRAFHIHIKAHPMQDPCRVLPALYPDTLVFDMIVMSNLTSEPNLIIKDLKDFYNIAVILLFITF